MNTDRLLRIANRINLLLLRELAQGVDVRRVIAEPRYARDVLLVCDALPGSDLASLAQHFRSALAEPADRPAGASRFGADSTAFGITRGGADSELGALLKTHPVPARWFSPGRWLAR